MAYTQGLEVELSDVAVGTQPLYFADAGASTSFEVSLIGGATAFLARSGPDSGGGLCFSVPIGDRTVLGIAPPSMDTVAVTEFLSSMRFEATPDGLQIHLLNAVTWSPYRVPDLIFHVQPASGAFAQVTVKPTSRAARRVDMANSLKVRGGRLWRVESPNGDYLALESVNYVTYFQPDYGDDVPATHLDEVSEVAAATTVDLAPL